MLSNDFRLVIVGGGPGGLAPLLAAHRNGRLDEVLDAGVAIIDRADQIGAGQLGDYAINSDSTGFTFVDCLTGPAGTRLSALKDHPLSKEVAAADQGAVPLSLAGRFMALVGETIRDIVGAHPRCRVLTGHEVVSVQRRGAGWVAHARNGSGETLDVSSRYVLSATGGHQPHARLETEQVGGIRLAERCGSKLVQSGDVVGPGGLERVAERLAGKAEPKVVIIGGSTSAISCAVALLNRLEGVRFGEGGLTILHRRELRVFYPTVEAALAEGYTEFDENDICPLSKRVFRLAGFRLDSRELVMQARGIGGRAPEPRVRLHRITPDDQQVGTILDEADLVIAALGYRPRGLPVLDASGAPIELLANQQPQAPLIDQRCRVLDADGQPIPGLYGLGLAAGFVPRGALGGEPSFVGQANGLWLWQNDVGLMIIEAVLDGEEDERSAAAGRHQDHRVQAVAGGRI